MYNKYVKRLLDFIISIILIIILLPLILITFLITLIHLGFPIFDIRFPREGKNKKPFYMLKFRTRVYDTGDLWGRKTKLSYAIDKLRLNELPQLFNVLKGDMSFVGPRAFICGEKLPEGKISKKRYLVKPGLTGLFQIKKGGTHKDKLQCDIEYYDNLNFMLDLKIFLKTPIILIKKVFNKKNKPEYV